jgi:hypothetical protein
MRKFTNKFGIVLPLVSVLMVGCGGDDSSGGSSFQAPAISTTPVSITAQNAEAVAASAVVALEASSSMSDSYGVVGGFKVGSAAVGQSALIPMTLNKMKSTVAATIADGGPIASPVGVVQSQTENCQVSGTISITTNTQNVVQSENDLSAGDYFTMSANACNDGFETVSGSLTFTFNDANFTDISVVFNNFRVADDTGTVTIHGDIQLEMSDSLFVLNSTSATITVSGQSLFFVESGTDLSDAVHLTSYSITVVTSGSSYTIDSGMTVDSTMIDGRLVITASGVTGLTSQTNPSSGSVEIVGNDSKLIVVILSDTQVRLDLDLGNDGSIDVTNTVPWVNITS